MKFKLKNWVKYTKVSAQLNSPEIKKTATYFKTSVLSIIIGIVLTMILISMLGTNPISFFLKTIDVVINRKTNLDIVLVWFAVYGLFGIGLAIGFKVGLFNMSGSGQAVISMGMTGIVLIKMFETQPKINMASPALIVLILIIMVGMSMLMSSIIGILKVYFNIHEVATSILLNWTIWYIFKWAFSSEGWNSSTPLIPSAWLDFGGMKWLLPLIILAVVFLVAWFVLTFTTTGYKFKLIGTQPEAGRYVGINFKKYIISATAIQGLCIGLGSFVYWSSLKYSYSMNNDLIPTIGFDSLAISLIAFNNILGILPISFLWAFMNVGMPVAVTTFPELGREVAPLIFGFIVYSTTFATLVARVRPVSWIKYSIYLLVDRPMKIKCRMHKEEIKVIKNKIKLIKSNEFDNEYPTLKSMHNGIMKMHEENVKIPKDIADEFAIEKEEALIILRKEILVLKSLISELKEKGYEVYKKNSYRGMIIGFKNKQKRIKWDLLNPAIKDLNELRDQKILVKEKINLLLNSKKIETNSIKLNIKNLKKQIKDIKKNKFNNKNEDLIILKNEIDLLGKDNLGLIETKKAQLENNKEKIITELNNKIMLLENKIQEILQRDDSENLQKIIELKKELPEFKLKEDNLNENWSIKISELKKELIILNNTKKENANLFKNDYKEIVENNSQINKEELQVLKFETQMKLGEKYGCK